MDVAAWGKSFQEAAISSLIGLAPAAVIRQAAKIASLWSEVRAVAGVWIARIAA